MKSKTIIIQNTIIFLSKLSPEEQIKFTKDNRGINPKDMIQKRTKSGIKYLIEK